ncbi:MAG: RNA methyltransferase [Caulobacteraceae bacterium]
MVAIRIDDPADPRVEPYRDLRERDLARLGRGFIAEGEVVLQKLATAGRYPIASVLLAERRVEKLQPLLDGLADAIPIYVCAQPVLDAICGFPLHRGVLACGAFQPQPSADSLLSGLGSEAVVVCLMGVCNHDNMGGIFRNAAAFGADAVLLDAGCCDPLYRKAIRVSVGASLTTPFARLSTGEDMVERLRAFGVEPLALSPAGEVELHRVDRAGRMAVLFGSEGPGLSDDVLARCRTVRLAMAGGFDSLNVATTSGIVLHHLATAARA